MPAHDQRLDDAIRTTVGGGGGVRVVTGRP